MQRLWSQRFGLYLVVGGAAVALIGASLALSPSHPTRADDGSAAACASPSVDEADGQNADGQHDDGQQGQQHEDGQHDDGQQGPQHEGEHDDSSTCGRGGNDGGDNGGHGGGNGGGDNGGND